MQPSLGLHFYSNEWREGLLFWGSICQCYTLHLTEILHILSWILVVIRGSAEEYIFYPSFQLLKDFCRVAGTFSLSFVFQYVMHYISYSYFHSPRLTGLFYFLISSDNFGEYPNRKQNSAYSVLLFYYGTTVP
jgi:hypothetical protein